MAFSLAAFYRDRVPVATVGGVRVYETVGRGGAHRYVVVLPDYRAFSCIGWATAMTAATSWSARFANGGTA